MTDSERKRIPDLGRREAKGITTMLFSFEGVDAKNLLSEEGHRDIEGTQIFTSSAKYWGAVPMMTE